MVLPSPITHQDRLLTIDTNNEPCIDIGAAVPGVHLTPLFLDSENGVWVMLGRFEPGTQVPMHFHTGAVHFFTTKGEWNYLEYPNDVQKAGSYLYEPGGSIHTFSVPADASEPAEGFMVVCGANVNFTAEGEFVNVMDAGWLERTVLDCAKAQGKPALRYIRPGPAAFTASR